MVRKRLAAATVLVAVAAVLTPGRVAAGPTDPVSELACTQRAGPGSEFGSCLGVTAAVDRVPSVGETATLTVTVRADRAFPDVAVSVELPAQLDWATAPAGLTTGTTTSTRPERPGRLPTARATVTTAPGRPVTYTLAVKGVTAGSGQIEASALAGANAGRDAVPVTVAAAGARSAVGVPPANGTAVLAPAGRAEAQRPAWLEPRAARPVGGGVTTLACNAHAIGGFGYTDETNHFRKSMNMTVRLRDANGTQLAVGVTGFAGAFDLCFDRNVAVGALDVTFSTENSVWRVQDNVSGQPMRWTTERHPIPAAGGSENFFERTVADPLDNRGVHAFDEGNDAWLFVPRSATGCFDVDDTVCRQMRIRWGRTIPPVAETPPYATHYDTVANTVVLEPDDPNAHDIVVHEMAHAIMDDVYNDAPIFVDCTGHAINAAKSQGCAWSEGFADWFPLAVYRESGFRFVNGAVVDIEGPTWLTPDFTVGDFTEGRVAGALLDMIDTNNEPDYDSYTESFTTIWSTFTRHVDSTFASFWNSRGLDGFDRSDTGALRALFQNTLDYGLREVLRDNQPAIYRVGSGFRIDNVGTPTWSAVAVVPPDDTTSYSMRVYGDRDQTPAGFLTGSQHAAPQSEFVAFDNSAGNSRTFFPQVRRFIGGQNLYYVEFQRAPAQPLPRGTSAASMGNLHAICVRMLGTTAGVPVTVSVTPAFATLDLGLYVMAPGQAVQPRDQRIAVSSTGVRGATQTVTFTPTVTGFYGIVVTNNFEGFGDFTFTVSP